MTQRRNSAIVAVGIIISLSLLFVLSVTLSSASQPSETPSAAAPDLALSTPALIDRAHAQGLISNAERLELLDLLLRDPAALPSIYASDAIWHGSSVAREVDAARRNGLLPALPTQVDRLCGYAGYTEATTVVSSTNFVMEYTTISAGLTAQQYLDGLELAFDKYVTEYGWAKPPISANNPYSKYPVQIAPEGSTYGYVTTNGGAYTELIGDNPNTPATETDAYATCMVLNDDFSQFPGTPLGALNATTGHEYVHSIQYAYGDPEGEENGVWYESVAAYMEDEVDDASNDNYQYLWPRFTSSLALYPFDSQTIPQYSNWIFYRYAAERFGGTNVADGGENIAQRLWENIGAGQSAITAYDNALEVSGTNLNTYYHNYAIATKFMLACGGDEATYCYEEAAGYLAADGKTGTLDNHGDAAIGTPYAGSLNDNYSLNWVGLPNSGTYNLDVARTAGEGLLQVSIVAEVNGTLNVTAFPNLVSDQAGQVAYTVPDGATSVVAVITNQFVSPNLPANDTLTNYTVTASEPSQTTPTPTTPANPSATPTSEPNPSATPTSEPNPSATPTSEPNPSATPTSEPNPSATPTTPANPSATPTTVPGSPVASINFEDGAPGSSFVVTFTNLLPNNSYRVTVNGIVVAGPFTSDAGGTLAVLLNTEEAAGEGDYIVGLLAGPYLSQANLPTTTYTLSAGAPLRAAPTNPPANSATVPTNVAPVNLSATINFANGAPGSSFVVTFTGLTPNSAYRIAVNEVVVSSAFNTNAQGELVVLLITSVYAQEGDYVVSLLEGPYLAQAANPTVTYTIDGNAPLRLAPVPPPTNAATVGENVPPVPVNNTPTIYLPLIDFDAPALRSR